MKKIITSLSFFSILLFANAQKPFDYLDINNVKSRINSFGGLFADFKNWTTAQFEVPKGSGQSTIFTSNLWIGGIEGGGKLHLAAETYRQKGKDFFYGPISNSGNPAPSQWNRVWKINKTTVDSFRLGLFTQIPQIILDWPGNGNTSIGQAQNLAPYVDVNSDNIYTPNAGDYPNIRGDQTVYFIFNDDSFHTESGGIKLGMEIHGTAYAFNNPSDTTLNHTIFFHYNLINRSAFKYDSVYVGNWTDLDLGCYTDDFIACDAERSAYYIYNGNKNDANCSTSGYGMYPPSQAVLFLNGPLADAGDGIDNNHNCQIDESNERLAMSHFLSYNNFAQLPTDGNPNYALQYYYYLKTHWLNGLPATYGGNGYPSSGMNCSYIFPNMSDQTYGWGTGGNCVTPNVQIPWDEKSAGNTPGDRRGVGSYGPFTLMPGSDACFDFAYVFARTKDTINDTVSVGALQKAIDKVRGFYFANKLDSCFIIPLGINEHDNLQNQINIFPNPSSDFISVTYKSKTQNSQLEILDVMGRKVAEYKLAEPELQINISKLPQGLYLLKVTDVENSFAKRFVKQ